MDARLKLVYLGVAPCFRPDTLHRHVFECQWLLNEVLLRSDISNCVGSWMSTSQSAGCCKSRGLEGHVWTFVYMVEDSGVQGLHSSRVTCL